MKTLKLSLFLAFALSVAISGVPGAETNGLRGVLLPQADRPLAARFADPPASARIIKIIHKQPDDPAAQDKLLRSLAMQGFGGFVGNVAFDGYLEDEKKWPAFLRGVREAKAAGMSLWLYDERGYPSGNAGDLTLRGHPEWAARGFLIADTNSTGGEVTLQLPPGELILASAFPVRDGVIALDQARDLAASVKAGWLRWQAPAGNWRVMTITEDFIFEGTHAALSLAYKLPCSNLLMPEPTARFLEVTHDRYAARLGQDLGKWFVSTFTDEPSLMSLWLRPMPYRVLPSAPKLADEFLKRRGYVLKPVLPALAAEAGPRGAKARYDFWLTIGELVSENYFGQIQEWCHRHHVASGGHLLMEESLTSHVPLYGDFFRCARRLDAPSIDCLTSLPPQVPWFIARLLGSVADLEGRTVTMSETSDHSQRYRPPGDTRPIRPVTEDEIRGTCNRLLWGGINRITSYYAFAGLSDEQLRRLNQWVGRCSTMLEGGPQIADLAVLYPIESIWPKFTPALHGATDSVSAMQVQHVYRAVSDVLYSANRDFTFVDSRALTEAKAQGDALVHGKLRWRVLVLPATDTMPLAAWENVARFWRGGGVVIAVGALPANSEKELPSARVQALARDMFGGAGELSIGSNAAGGAGVFLPASMTALLPVVLDRLLERDARCEDPRAPLKSTHRSVDGHEVYFVINDSSEPWSGKIQLSGKGAGEQWNPATGSMTSLAALGVPASAGAGTRQSTPLPAKAGTPNEGVFVPLQLGPYGAMLFRFPEAQAPRRLRGSGGALPKFAFEPLVATKPTIGKGTHVQAALTGDAKTGWRAAATLTKGQVDTHLFLSFESPQGFGLSGADGVAVETAVPRGQASNTQVLVILHEQDGADYIASTGRPLGTAGGIRSQLLFNQFNLAGWSKDANGRLDLSTVTAIRVGWGGYFGQEGETVEFTANVPQRFTLR